MKFRKKFIGFRGHKRVSQAGLKVGSKVTISFEAIITGVIHDTYEDYVVIDTLGPIEGVALRVPIALIESKWVKA